MRFRKVVRDQNSGETHVALVVTVVTISETAPVTSMEGKRAEFECLDTCHVPLRHIGVVGGQVASQLGPYLAGHRPEARPCPIPALGYGVNMSCLSEDLTTREKESHGRRPGVRQPIVVALLVEEDEVVDAGAKFRGKGDQAAFAGFDGGAIMACVHCSAHDALRVVGEDRECEPTPDGGLKGVETRVKAGCRVGVRTRSRS